MKISTEAILTGIFRTDGWEPTPMQLAIGPIRDGVPMDPELRVHPDVVAGCGGAEAIAAMPSERGIKPSECWIVASARTAKTTLAVAGAIADVLNLDLSSLGPGEIPRVSITSVKLDVADVPYRKLRAAFEHPTLKPLLIDERDSDRTLMIRHPSGRPVEFAVVAGGKAAGGLAARWCAGFVADEAPRQASRDDAVTSLTDCLSVVRERLLPGAQIMPIGSPWSPHGDCYDVVQAYFGKPTDDIVCLRMTGPAGNPAYWTPERLEKLQAKDEVAWRINALGEFIDPESGLLSPIAVRRNTRETPLELLPAQGAEYSAAVDPAEGGAAGNAWTLIIVEQPADADADGDDDRYRVALAREWRGMGPDACWQAIAAECARYGLSRAGTDQYAAAANVDLAKRHGLALDVDKTTAVSKLEDFTNLATLIHTDSVELPPDRQLRSDLLAIKRRTTQAGATIILPRTSDGRHCDFAPALAAALKRATAAAGRIDLSTWRVGLDDPDPIPPPYGYSRGLGRAWRDDD